MMRGGRGGGTGDLKETTGHAFAEGCTQISAAGVVIVHALDAFTTPPARFPDLYTIGNVLVSCGTFFVCLLYFSVHQLRAAI